MSVSCFIMRGYLFASVFFISTIVNGQGCRCDKDTMLKEYISCKPKYFDNSAKLYWNFNCDSSWLTFESSKGKKKIIFSLGEGLVALTTRLGHVSFTEFNSSFLVTNKVISGCCAPDDYYHYDKISGKLIKYLGRALYVSKDKNYPIVVSITKSNYNINSIPDLKTLTIYHLNKRREFKITIPKVNIEKGMKNNDFLFPEYVFDNTKVLNGKLILQYFIQDYRKNRKIDYKIIAIDLKKFSS